MLSVPWISFQLFNIASLSNFLIELAIFFQVFFSFFRFFLSQEPRNLLNGLVLGYYMVDISNGTFFKIIISQILAICF